MHKRIVKELVRKGEKRRQKRLTSRFHQRLYEFRNNPGPRR